MPHENYISFRKLGGVLPNKIGGYMFISINSMGYAAPEGHHVFMTDDTFNRFLHYTGMPPIVITRENGKVEFSGIHKGSFEVRFGQTIKVDGRSARIQLLTLNLVDTWGNTVEWEDQIEKKPTAYERLAEATII